MDSGYFIPQADDFRIGYEYEMNDGYQWVKQIYPNPWFAETTPRTISTLSNCLDEKGGLIRVQYLTKEQIESEGWEQVGENQYNYIINSLSLYSMIISGDSRQIEVMQEIMDFSARIYRGECRCINDFRWIMRRLGIKK